MAVFSNIAIDFICLLPRQVIMFVGSKGTVLPLLKAQWLFLYPQF